MLNKKDIQFKKNNYNTISQIARLCIKKIYKSLLRYHYPLIDLSAKQKCRKINVPLHTKNTKPGHVGETTNHGVGLKKD